MNDSRHATQQIREAQGRARQLVVDGDPWIVYELPPTPFDRRSSPSLVFESDHVMRRVRNFPADWRGLDDEALFAVSWGG